MNNHRLSLVTLIGLLLIATACNMPALSGIKDCGEDMECFVEAGKNCDPAKLLFPLELEMMGVKITTTTYQEIVGMEEDLCAFKIRTESITVDFTQEAIDQMLAMGLSQEDIDAQIEMTQEQVGQEGLNQICRVEPERLATVMEQWGSGSFSTEDWEGMDCEEVVGEE